MHRIISLALFMLVWIPLSALATAQIPDQIVLDGEASRLHSEPLKALLAKRTEDGGIKLSLPLTTCTGNWRGYQAFWQIRDDRLYLAKVVTDACADEPKEVRMATLFKDGSPPVPADWYTGVLTIPKGKQTSYATAGYMSRYERYVILILKKGLVVARVDFDEPPQ